MHGHTQALGNAGVIEPVEMREQERFARTRRKASEPTVQRLQGLHGLQLFFGRRLQGLGQMAL